MRPLLTVFYTGEPDEIVEFRQDGHEVEFGRDDALCDLVVWEELAEQSLSRVAGRIWRQWGQLWLANLSSSHDLFVQPQGRPPEDPLPAQSPGGPLSARTLPGPRCFVTGPTGRWALVVEQQLDPALPGPPGADVVTLRAPAVPGELRDVAAALCEPLFLGGRLPATYAQVGARLDVSLKTARGRVDRLVGLYEDHNPILRRHREAREARRDAHLAGPDLVRSPGGIRRPASRPAPGPAPPVKSRTSTPPGLDLPEAGQSSLPRSYDVAHLLVRRGLVTSADVERLAR